MSIQTRTNALQNEVVKLFNTFSFNGTLTNPVGQPMVEILDCDGVTVLDVVSAQLDSTGTYFASWYVPANLPLGDYYDRWTFQWASDSSVEEQTNIFNVFSLSSYINFVSNGTSVKASNRARQLINDLKFNFIHEAMHKPVYWEQGRRIRQEDQQKRRKSFYYFELASEHSIAKEGDIYFHNGNKYTVTKTIFNASSSSTDSSSTSSIDSSSSQSITSSSSSESSSSNSSSSTSSLDSSSSTSSSSTSQGLEYDSEIVYVPTVVLSAIGTGDPKSSGSLTLVSGCGDQSIDFTDVTKKVGKFSTIFDFAFKNWNQDPRPIVRLNNTRIVDDGWHADYQGKIYMDGLMAPEDFISVSYRFSYFSDDELLSFLKFGLQMMNSIPPASQQYASLEVVPLTWDPGIVLWAAITALKRIVFGLNCQEVQLIFGGPDNINSEEAAKHAQQIFKDLYAEYNETWKEFAENVKSKRLPGLAIAIQPEYTLPGGRCMSSDTCITCRINGTEEVNTIKDLYDLFSKNVNIEVMSMLNGLPEYSKVSKIWYSGEKQTYVVRHDSGSIRLSEEHLVYMPETNKYIPVKDIQGDDKILIFENNSFEVKPIISKPEPYKVEEVFDIEVPIAENFVGNGIVTHNSRWFRYLFKGGS